MRRKQPAPATSVAAPTASTTDAAANSATDRSGKTASSTPASSTPASSTPASSTPASSATASAPIASGHSSPAATGVPGQSTSQPQSGFVVDIRGLAKTYRMGSTSVHALRGIDLSIRKGEMVAIMGTSGSGKSTLMNLLGCLDRPDAGTYELDSVEIGTLDRDALADIRNEKIGFVFQGFNLLARTSALENVELPLLYDRRGRHRNPGQAAEAALRQVGLGDRLDHEPSELSGGQQQRVAIARALVTAPALLLADEPTGNLDSRTSVEVMATFQELNANGLTILIVTHEPDIALYTQRIVELRDGQIIRDVPVEHPRSAAADIRNLKRDGGTEAAPDGRHAVPGKVTQRANASEGDAS